MAKSKRFRLFISHATPDSRLAGALKRLFCERLGLSDSEVFVSSDGNSMVMGRKDDEQITVAHQQADAIVLIMTPNSLTRPWVIYEAGGANFASKPLFVVLANGLGFRVLPPPIATWHVGSLGDKHDVVNLCASLSKLLRRKSTKKGDGELQQVVKLAKKGSRDWEFVRIGLMGEKMNQSPFNFDSILSRAAEEIAIGGQNLYHITRRSNSRRYIVKIFSWLGKKKGRKCYILVNDYRNKEVVKAWSSVIGPDYGRHLKHSTSVFKSWAARARKEKLDLIIKVTDFVPVTTTFVDPNENDGFLVLTPVMYKPLSSERPHFVLTKTADSSIFDYYWNSFWDRFDDQSRNLTP